MAENRMEILKTNPIRAAKIFGPALIKFSFNAKLRAMLFESIAKILYLERSVDLKKKSITKKLITSTLPVKAKVSRNNTVKKPFNRATVSFIFLLEIGQMA